MTTNLVRVVLAERAALGVLCLAPAPFVQELLATQAFDFLCIDTQHGLHGEEDLLAILHAVARIGPTAAVRVAANDPARIGRALDAGAEVIVVPMVNSPEEAAQAVAACRYPPDGIRSFGPTRASLFLGTDPATVNAEVMCLVMIETAAAVAAAEEICAVPGVDGIYVGPTDLAVSLGLGPSPAPDDERLAAAIDHTLAACRAHTKVPGIHALHGDGARAYIELGFRFVTVGTDTSMLLRGARHRLRAARQA